MILISQGIFSSLYIVTQDVIGHWFFKTELTVYRLDYMDKIYGPSHKRTNNVGFQSGPTQTSMCRQIEAWNFGADGLYYLYSWSVPFFLAYTCCWFSYAPVHIVFITVRNKFCVGYHSHLHSSLNTGHLKWHHHVVTWMNVWHHCFRMTMPVICESTNVYAY